MALTRSGKSKRQFIIEAIEPRVLLSKTIYVDVNASGTTHDGTSWTNAFVDLQQALAIDAAGDEIHVADGTYKPTSTADPAASFVLESGVKIYGGYAGSGASNPDQRDIALFPSVLSGDIGTLGDKLDNTSTLVIADGVDSSTRLDGFTLTAVFRNALIYGGAIRNIGGSPVIANCSFVMNYAFCGGAMYNLGGSPQLENCTFLNNGDNYYGSMGGAIANDSATVTLSNCTFDGNTSGEGYGGAFYNKNSTLVISGITFKNNFGCLGGGMYNDSSVIQIEDGVFQDVYNESSNLTIARGKFNGPGGIYNSISSVTELSDCTFTGCTGGSYAVIENRGQGADSLVLSDCVFTGNKSAVHGIVNATRCFFNKNTAGAVNGGGQFIDCTFDGNSGTQGSAIFGGGMMIGCKFYRNSASDYGGAIAGGALNAVNCVFIGNSARDGGAIFHYSGDLVLTNCTFAENSATERGRSLSSGNSSVTLNNVIMWDSTATGVPFVVAPTANLQVNYCDIQGGYYLGSTAIYSDPLFLRTPSVGKDGKWGTADDDLGDLHLSQLVGSAAIDAGSNGLVPAGIDTDLAGNPRMIDAPGLRDPGVVVDMGAYETVPTLQASAGGPYTAVQGERFQPKGLGCSGVAGDLTFAWEWSGDGLFDEASGASPLCSAASLPVGSSTIWLRVTDAAGHSVTSSTSITVLPATAIYVDAKATGAGTGLNWTDAYSDLAAALGAATSGAVIRVAGGTYRPTSTSDRKISFTLKSLVSVYGGFAGLGATNPDQRNLVKYATILSGDIGVAGDVNDNSLCVVWAGLTDATAILDGVTITAGRGNGDGAGMTALQGSPSILNCRFAGNAGGAVRFSGSTSHVINSVFVGNTSVRGGAIRIAANTPVTFTNCTFTANSATISGGAIHGPPLAMVNCILWDNSAPTDSQIYGSGMFVTYSDIQGGISGVGNVDADPRFCAIPSSGRDGQWGTADDDYGDLRVRLSSPCVDSGSNAAVPSAVGSDVAGSPRRIDVPGVLDPGVIVDMGAYERAAPFADGVFQVDAPRPSAKITFNSDVQVSSLSSSDLLLVNRDTGVPINCGTASVVSYDAVTRTATWQFPSVLPDGNYSATLPAGNVLDTTGSPILTVDLVFDFFVFAGDANRDQVVDIRDLSILAANWQGAGKIFSQGDFNYDGKVDAKDLGILSTRWQQALPPAPPTPPVSIVRAPTRTATRMVSVVG